MQSPLVTSFTMTSIYPDPSRRLRTYISPAAAAQNFNDVSKKDASPLLPSPATSTTVLTSPPTTDTRCTPTRRPKRVKKDQDEHSVTKSTTTRATPTTTARTNRASTAPTQAQSRPRHNAAASLPVMLCNLLDEVINKFIDPPQRRPTVDPRHVLSGNFAPVDELPPTPCPVVRGAIPRCLAGGAYIRNGPNPQHRPRGTHHLFDGDGMLHSLLLPVSSSSAEPAVLCSRYVQTYKYLVERDAGVPIMPNLFAGFHGVAGLARLAVVVARMLSGQIDLLGEGIGLANTSLVFFSGHLYALFESDLPYAVRIDPATGEVTTLGRSDFGGRLAKGMSPMTAHPKKDPVTAELFAFRYSIVPPFVTYFRFDPVGNKAADVPIFSVRQPSFLHDFFVTERYAIFPEVQLVVKPMDMVVGGGAPVGMDSGIVPQLGVLPRYATDESEMRWFEVPGFNMLHSVNAWEEAGGEELVLVAPNILSIEHILDSLELMHACVEMVRINLRTGAVSRTPLSPDNLEFGVIHPGYAGRRNRYGYFGIFDPVPKIAGVIKLDFDRAGTGDCTVARRDFGPGCFAGEPFFVPADVDRDSSEDDGYVVCYVHDEGTSENRFVVMDARSPELHIVAEVHLPGRVPYGFHGLFVTRAELLSQQE